MKSLILACSNFSETLDPLLVHFGHQIVVFAMCLWHFSNFGHHFIVFAVVRVIFAQLKTVVRIVCGVSARENCVIGETWELKAPASLRHCDPSRGGEGGRHVEPMTRPSFATDERR